MALTKNQKKKLKKEIFEYVGCNDGFTDTELFENLVRHYTDISLTDITKLCKEMCEGPKQQLRVDSKGEYRPIF